MSDSYDIDDPTGLGGGGEVPALGAVEGELLDRSAQGNFAHVWRRMVLTWRYLGPWILLWRIVTFPLRFTPLRHHLSIGPRMIGDQRLAERWYRRHGDPVDVVIPSYRDAGDVARLVASIRRTTPRGRVRIIVSDDASGPEHLAALRAIDGIDEIVEAARNGGFAANVNRGLGVTDPTRDVVLLNSDTIALPGWLACLQRAIRYGGGEIGIAGAQLLYPDNRIQFGGTIRNLGAPEWFDHRHRFKASSWGPANVPQPALSVTGACMYISRATLDDVGVFDEAYPMAYEDVDYCLRCWRSGRRVEYVPAARLRHLESATRGSDVNERELESQRVFWERWGDFFDAREVTRADGSLRVIYVTEDTGVGGGHRDIFEHLNGLTARGHEVALFTLGDQPDWFDLRVPVHSFEDYDELMEALAPLDAIKVATWWNTAAPVWRSSVLHGIPVYFVQDIETSYYPDDPGVRHAVIASYQAEFRYMTISSWNRDRLRELGLDATLIPPGIELDTFRPLEGSPRRADMILALGRTNPLKRLGLTLEAWRALPQPRPELCLFGIEPELADGEEGIRYVERPSDAEVNALFNAATVFVQTSTHEGFCLPPLESMATGGAVVCTDAHGNRDFCRDGENCLMPEPTAEAVAGALSRLLDDASLRARLGEAGRRTAAEYAWPLRIDALEAFLREVATPRRVGLEGGPSALPQLERQAR